MHYHGLGVPRNYTISMAWLQRQLLKETEEFSVISVTCTTVVTAFPKTMSKLWSGIASLLIKMRRRSMHGRLNV